MDLPYERVDHLESSLDFYTEIQPSIINSFYLSYYPTTAIIWDGIRDGKIDPEDVDAIEDGKYITSFTLSLGGDQDSNSEQVSNYQKYFAMFTLIAVLPKRVSEFILKKGLNHGLIGKLPTALLIFLKVVLRFKVGQSYLYTGIVKEQIDNYFRNKRLISDYKSSVVNSAKDNDGDDTAARLLKTITATGVEQKTAVERNRKVPQFPVPAPRPAAAKLTMGQCP